MVASQSSSSHPLVGYEARVTLRESAATPPPKPLYVTLYHDARVPLYHHSNYMQLINTMPLYGTLAQWYIVAYSVPLHHQPLKLCTPNSHFAQPTVKSGHVKSFLQTTSLIISHWDTLHTECFLHIT